VRAVAILCGFLATSSALAGTVESTVDPDGFVRVQMDLTHSQEAVRSFLADTEQTMRLGGDVRKIEAEPDGDCIRMTITTRGFIRPMRLVARRCPTAQGWHSKLVESEDFDAHEIVWKTEPVDGGTRVTMKVRVIPRLPVPQILIRKVVSGALEATIMRLDALLGSG